MSSPAATALAALFILPFSLECVALIPRPTATAAGQQSPRVSLGAVSAARGSQTHGAAKLDLGAGGRSRSSDGAQSGQAIGPFNARWFDGFSQAESTYTAQGIDGKYDQIGGWDVDLGGSHARSGEWFQETPSAGAAAAWQTFYPAVPSSAGNRDQSSGHWRQTPEGYVQDYSQSDLRAEAAGGAGKHPAHWFDTSVLNVDGFGRRQLPYPGTRERLLDSGEGEPFVERKASAPLRCSGAGCTAHSRLQAFDAEKEQARSCELSLHLHPTDFDGGREALDPLLVNGRRVATACGPIPRGCNKATAKWLYPCVDQVSLDSLLDGHGDVNVSGQISEMVDECPFEGDLLSGIVTVTCMVRNKTNTSLEHPRPAPDESRLRQLLPDTANASALLRCASPGCRAYAALVLDPTIANMGGVCLMNVTVVPTDFDGDLGAPEEVESLELEGHGVLLRSTSPGSNPCNDAEALGAVDAERKAVQILKDFNVTSHVAALGGHLKFAGRISDKVDECPSNGFLLDAEVSVRCHMPPGWYAQHASAKAEVLLAARLQRPIVA